MSETDDNETGLQKSGIHVTSHDKIILVTVPHTGTCALKYALCKEYDHVQDFPNKIRNPRLIEKNCRQLVCLHFRKTAGHIINKPWKKISLIRDPMLTFISQAARKNFEKDRIRPARIFESWYLFAKYYNHGDLEIVDINDFDCEFVSSTSDYSLHEAYKKGDIDKVKNVLGGTWDEVVKMKPLLEPVFEKEGYGPYLWQD